MAFGQGSASSFGCPEGHHVEQSVLSLEMILLSLCLLFWDFNHVQPCTTVFINLLLTALIKGVFFHMGDQVFNNCTTLISHVF